MTSANDWEAEAAFAALIHRLASPLGAIANYAHMLEGESKDTRRGILDAVASTQAVLRSARSWLDALATLDEPPPTNGVALDAALTEAIARRESGVRVETGALPRVAAPAAAVARLLDALLSEAETAAAQAPAVLAVTAVDEDDVHVTFRQSGRPLGETLPTGSSDLFKAADPGSNARGVEPAIAASLARRLGGRVWWSTTATDGEALIHLVLPAAPSCAVEE